MECLEVDAVRLDDILEQEKYKSLFIKTDTDGNELEVLKSLSATYDRCDDISILLELNPKMLKLAGSSCEEIIEYLESRDFKLFAIDDKEFRYYPLHVKGNLERMCSLFETSYFNVLCIKSKKTLSVLFFSHSANVAGAERDLLEKARGLLERTVLCTVVLPEEGKLVNLLKEVGCGVIVLPEKVRAKLSWWWCDLITDIDVNRNNYDLYDIVLNNILPELKKVNPDMIFSQTITSPWGAVCAGLLGISHVLSVREYGHRDYLGQFYYGFEKSMFALYKDSDAVFCITDDVKNSLFGPDEDKKTSVIYSQVQLIDVNENTEINKYYNSNWETGISVGVFGTISKGKGQEDIVRACIELWRKGYNLKCILAGYISDNEYLKNLETLIEQSGFSHHFIRYDFTDKPYKLMKNTDIIVSCSKLEALGRTLLESILLYRPIIYVNAGGPKEIFIDGVHGLAYESGDYLDLAKKILQTVNNIEETRKRINTANEYVTKKFNAEIISDNIYKTLKALTKKVSINNNNAVAELIYGSMLKDTSGILLKPRLYYSNKKNDFNEQQHVVSQKIPFGIFSVSFILPEGAWKYLRFDPTEEYYVELEIYKIVLTTAFSEIIIDPAANIFSNGMQKNKQSWSFSHLDPQIIINPDSEIKGIEICGELIKIDAAQVIETVNPEVNEVDFILNEPNVEIVNEQLNQNVGKTRSFLSWQIARAFRFISSLPKSIKLKKKV
ncbi:MAG: glycosyltransferase [Saprospiraceae bacterium]